tara:strand:+ start:1275 stop:1514 length:240 start_codon:yes stop_codon:yes gene_type:complete
MIDAILILNAKGDLLLQRLFRDGVSNRAFTTFRLNVICAKEVRSPILTINNATYIFIRSEDVYVVAISYVNPDVCMVRS